jgi:hypothetical protein
MFKYKYISLLSLCLLLTSMQAYAQPSNDLCSGAIDVSGLIGNEMGVPTEVGPFTNVGATAEEGLSEDLVGIWFDSDANGFQPSVDQTVWFHFTGDGNTYQFRTKNCPGAGFYSNDTQLALYQGTCDNPTFVGANDDLMGFWSSDWGWYYSFLNFKAELDVEYWLMVDGFNWNEGTTYQGVAEGTFCVSSVKVQPLTDHNTCTDALILDDFLSATENNPNEVGPFDNTVLGSNIMPDLNADNIGIECWEDGPTEDGSVWFTFTGNGNAYTISPSYCGDDNFVYFWGWDAQMAIYTGLCGELVPVGCGEDYDQENNMYWPEVGLDTQDGVTYYVRLDGYHWTNYPYEWTANGSFCLQAVVGNINSIASIAPLDVKFYPNPCHGDITLTWEGGDDVADVVAFDQLGKKVGVFLNVSQGQIINLNVSSGMYILNIRSDNHKGSVTVDVLNE